MPGWELGTAIPWLPGGVLSFPCGGISKGSPNPAFFHAGLSQNAPSQAFPGPFPRLRSPQGCSRPWLHPVLFQGINRPSPASLPSPARELSDVPRHGGGKENAAHPWDTQRGEIPSQSLAGAFHSQGCQLLLSPGSEVFRRAGMWVRLGEGGGRQAGSWRERISTRSCSALIFQAIPCMEPRARRILEMGTWAGHEPWELLLRECREPSLTSSSLAGSCSIPLSRGESSTTGKLLWGAWV